MRVVIQVVVDLSEVKTLDQIAESGDCAQRDRLSFAGGQEEIKATRTCQSGFSIQVLQAGISEF